MKITSVEARDLSEAWFLCLRQVLTDGYEYTIERGSYTGQKRKELDMITVHIKNPGNRPLIPDVPPGVPAPPPGIYRQLPALPYDRPPGRG